MLTHRNLLLITIFAKLLIFYKILTAFHSKIFKIEINKIYIFQGFSLHNLDSLVLIGCEVTDLDVAQILSQTPNLMRINLSGNENVTKESLHLMLKRKPTMTYINLHDCRLIKSLPENNLRIISPQCCELRVSMSPDVVGSWEKLWLGRVKVKKLPMNLYIFEPS